MRQKKFIKIYEKYAASIYRFIYLKVGNKEVANDLNSKVFLKLWKYSKKNNVKDCRAFLYKMARNVVIDYYRKNKEASLEEINFELPYKDKFKESLIVRNLLNQLKPNYREALNLYYIEGMSAKEVAKVLKQSEPAVRTNIHRGLKELYKLVKQAGE